jgi:anhydro-N-acetylmuramic acid kinase
MKKWRTIGLMSGSSLDGLDIAYCEFWVANHRWNYSVVEAETITYTDEWINNLRNVRGLSADQLLFLHNEYGKLLGEITLEFIEKYNVEPDIISSHGHTVFHNPKKGYTFQLGNGLVIAGVTGITTVADFRLGDILLGGQGAPLVPVGDELLFEEFDACLNIGGIANISHNENGKRLAFDVCPANQLLNHLSNNLKMDYDKDGVVASSGRLSLVLLDMLNNETYYQKTLPKSLSNEYIAENFINIIEDFELPLKDKLYTVTVHIADKISEVLKKINAEEVLITGGGAKNKFLIENIKNFTSTILTIPEKKIVDFKEAMIFAFLGVLKITGNKNCLASATGAKRDSSVGTIFNTF